MYLYNAATLTECSFSQARRNAVQAIPKHAILSSCKFKYNKRNGSCLVLVSLRLCLNHKESNKKVIHDLSSGQS